MASTEGEVRVVRADAIRFLESGAGGMKFDLVFSDPPYEREGAGGWLGRIACALEKGAVLASEGIWIMEQPRRQDVPTPPAWREIWRRVYGDTELRMLVPDSETR
jgi:16S rRNA G966 N2-methylase RsmD